jgi:hypothetical protein
MVCWARSSAQPERNSDDQHFRVAATIALCAVAWPTLHLTHVVQHREILSAGFDPPVRVLMLTTFVDDYVYAALGAGGHTRTVGFVNYL